MTIKDFFLELPDFINVFPDHGYLIILAFAFLEALAFVGALFPGTTIIIILGFFSYLKYWNFALVFLLIFIGALAGDTLSYWLGKKYGARVLEKLNGRKIYKWLNLDVAMNFLGENGIKSVIVGRIIGPSRAFVPFLVGAVDKDFKKFLNADIVSVFIWSILYLGIGAMFGSSMPLIEKLIDHIEYLFLLFIAMIFVLSLISKFTFGRRIKKDLRDNPTK
jgi:undecaprenyl-diphosphatase